MKFLELDEVIYTSGKGNSKMDSCFKKTSRFSKASLIKVFPIQCFLFFGTLKLGSWIDVANAFNQYCASNLNTNSCELRMPDENQNLLLLQDFCGLFSDSDIHQVILNSIVSSYEIHDDFPNVLFKKCTVIFATLFRNVFNCVILICQFPEIWKSSFTKPIHKKLNKITGTSSAGTRSPVTVQLLWSQRSL